MSAPVPHIYTLSDIESEWNLMLHGVSVIKYYENTFKINQSRLVFGSSIDSYLYQRVQLPAKNFDYLLKAFDLASSVIPLELIFGKQLQKTKKGGPLTFQDQAYRVLPMLTRKELMPLFSEAQDMLYSLGSKFIGSRVNIRNYLTFGNVEYELSFNDVPVAILDSSRRFKNCHSDRYIERLKEESLEILREKVYYK
jgi:hypothetical protein